MRARWRTRHLPALVPVAFALAVLLPRASTAQVIGDPCQLVTPAEMQSLLGSAVTLKPQTLGDVKACSAQVSTASAMVRLFKRTGDASGGKEKAGLETAKKMGIQIDVTSSNGITCMMMTPPATLAIGFTTSCTVTSKAPIVAVVEVTAKEEKDRVSAAKLRGLAEKMATRF